MTAGFFRGGTDMLISRLIDVLLAFPILLLAIGLPRPARSATAASAGSIKPGLSVVVFTITFVSWTVHRRIIRGQVLSIREKEFVEAARSLGASQPPIIFREILPTWWRRSSSTAR
jgi:ABC-type dipeptide/oligopeptide/nickel transport system permease subunit